MRVHAEFVLIIMGVASNASEFERACMVAPHYNCELFLYLAYI